ncbi:MAG: hypothetical protein EHM58_01830 [Ignavibacteriae bacterium]|nr:MAG: hypothetical protein EHM58_01830 [Ignavibacteriota bacterium]
MSDEEKYNELRARLRAVPKVKAKKEFEHRLYSRLRGVESERMGPSAKHLLHGEKQRGGLFSFLRPAYIPAIGLTAVVLIALIWYVAYNPGQMNKDEQVSVKQDTQQQPSSSTLGQTVEESAERNEKSKESPITSNDEVTSKDSRGSEPRVMTKEAISGPEKVNSDFNVIRNETEQPVEQKTMPVDEQIIKAIPKIDAEKKSEEKIDDGVRRIEKKEAPANIRKSEGDLKNKEDKIDSDQNKGTESIIKDIAPSIKEKEASKETSKDSVKQKVTKKKKKTEDKEIKQEEKSQEPDSIKKLEK